MFTLVIGGAASGKSEFAEELVVKLPGRRVYIATMEPFDLECETRIAKHQRQRMGKGFETLECYRNLSGLTVPEGANILLECMSNLTANERYSPEGGGRDAVLRGVELLLRRCANVTIVTNELFSGADQYEGDTVEYLKDLAAINRTLAAWADVVVEVVCACPNVLKGRLP